MKIDEFVESTFKICLGILRRKNQDYAKENDPFLNFRSSTVMGVEPERGILVRVLDKMQRIRNYLDKNELQNESVEDSIHDIINYMALLKGMLQERRIERERKVNEIVKRVTQ